MTFVNALILPALVLALGPLIIHLFFRRRFQRVAWAPMRYLKLTLRRNRRRLQLEHLLLLLLRTLIVTFLVLAVARPVASATGLGKWLRAQKRASHVLVVDNSLSMGYTENGPSSFRRAVDLAERRIEELPAHGRLTVVTPDRVDPPLVREIELTERSVALDAIESLSLSAMHADWRQVLGGMSAVLDALAQPSTEITLLTDLRRSGWDRHVADVFEDWRERGVSLTVIDVGSVARQNIALLGLAPERDLALQGSPLRIVAKVRNDGDSVAQSLHATLLVNGEPRPVLLPDLEPGVVATVPLTVTFPETGQNVVQFALPDDPLPQDNERWLVLDVKEYLEILLVDGQPSEDPFGGETDYLGLAFAVGDVAWKVERLLDSEWSSDSRTSPDVLVLANVGVLSGDRVRILERQVRAGMGLMVFPGDEIDPFLYNRDLFRHGEGVLPARIEGVNRDGVGGLVLDAMPESPLARMRALVPEALARISAQTILSVSLADDVPAKVMARWDDAVRSPALVARRCGRGKVLLWTVSADREWSDWPVDPTYVLAMRECVLSVARGSDQQSNFVAGTPVRYTLHEGASAFDVTVAHQEGAAHLAVRVAVPTGGPPALVCSRTPLAGVHTMTWRDATRKRRHLFAVNPDPRESALERLPEADLYAFAGDLPLQVLHSGNSVETRHDRVEFWRLLAGGVLAFMVMESMMTVWMGRRRG